MYVLDTGNSTNIVSCNFNDQLIITVQSSEVEN